MSAQFDLGGVLSRAQPVLTFATSRHTAKQVAARPSEATDPACTNLRARQSLPVIGRIVRRTSAVDRALLLAPGNCRQVTTALAGFLRRSGVGPLIVGVLALATLGAIAGLGMRSLSEEVVASATTTPAGADRPVDVTTTEGLLERAQPSPFSSATPSTDGDETGPSPTAPSAHPAVHPAPVGGAAGLPMTPPKKMPLSHPMPAAHAHTARPAHASARGLHRPPIAGLTLR
jgi:hypothetical protein